MNTKSDSTTPIHRQQGFRVHKVLRMAIKKMASTTNSTENPENGGLLADSFELTGKGIFFFFVVLENLFDIVGDIV